MAKVLWLLLVVVGVVLWWKHRQRGVRVPPGARAPSTETMVRCAQCGVHVPESQALPGRGGVFCSAEHRTRFEAER